jgi:ankyrin repeat protein
MKPIINIKQKDLENPTIELCYNLNEEELNFLLIESIKRNNPIGVSLALEFGANPETQNWDEELPIKALGIAFYLDFPLCAKLLLNGGADLLSTQLIPKKRHTIVEAFKEGNSLCIPIILSLFSHIDSVSHAGIGNLLSVAATQKNKEAVDLLISLGANPDGKCTIDDSFIDCEHGVLNRIILSKLQTKEKIEMLEFMISRGANPYGIYTEHIEYPYEIASVIDAKILEWFYNKGINIAIKGREAILLASISENSDSLELLHSLGFDLNAKTKDGINAMMIASINNCFDNAVILIKKGIDFDPDVCLKLAIEHDSQDMIRLLLSVGADRKLLKKTKTPKKS